MLLDIADKNLRNGVLGLVIALIEIIKEALQLQAIKRMEGGTLTEEEVERLGQALIELDVTIQQIKIDMGITESVKSVRDGLDRLVDDAINTILNPCQWEKVGGGISHEAS